jgi:hypothetical protein
VYVSVGKKVYSNMKTKGVKVLTFPPVTQSTEHNTRLLLLKTYLKNCSKIVNVVTFVDSTILLDTSKCFPQEYRMIIRFLQFFDLNKERHTCSN